MDASGGTDGSATRHWSVGLDRPGTWWSGMPERHLAIVALSPVGSLEVRGRLLWRVVIRAQNLTPGDVRRVVPVGEPDPRWCGVGVQLASGGWWYLWCAKQVARQMLEQLEAAGFTVEDVEQRADLKRERRLI